MLLEFSLSATKIEVLDIYKDIATGDEKRMIHQTIMKGD